MFGLVTLPQFNLTINHHYFLDTRLTLPLLVSVWHSDHRSVNMLSSLCTNFRVTLRDSYLLLQIFFIIPFIPYTNLSLFAFLLNGFTLCLQIQCCSTEKPIWKSVSVLMHCFVLTIIILTRYSFDVQNMLMFSFLFVHEDMSNLLSISSRNQRIRYPEALYNISFSYTFHMLISCLDNIFYYINNSFLNLGPLKIVLQSRESREHFSCPVAEIRLCISPCYCNANHGKENHK